MAVAAPEALAHVQDALLSPTLNGWGPYRVRGSVRFGRIVVWMRDGRRNSFRPVLVAIAEPVTEQSCVVTFRIQMFRFVTALSGAWIALSMAFAILEALPALFAGEAIGLVAFACPAFGVLLVAFGWHLARAQRAGLRDWLLGPRGVIHDHP